MRPLVPALLALVLASALPLHAEIPPNLVVEGVPAIPPTLQTEVTRYLAFDNATVRGWHSTRRELLIAARLGTVTHLHGLSVPEGPRTSLTTGPEPVRSGWFQPGGGDLLVYQIDQGGSEKFQLYALHTASPASAPVLVTDGQSRNTSPVWSYDGKCLAYASTRRNGKDSDIYLVNPADPATTRCLFTTDSPNWAPADWSRDGTRILIQHAVTEKETELWIVDARTGERTRVTSKESKVTFDQPCFAEGDQAIFALTDADSDFLTLARIDCATGARTPLTAPLGWDVEEFVLSADGRTLAYTINEDGFSRLHLRDVATAQELSVPKMPGDVLSNLVWHPRLRELGFTVNGAPSPSDAWSLETDTGKLTRWTERPSKPGNASQPIGAPQPTSTPQPDGASQPATALAFAEPEIARVTSSDGVHISSLVYRPDPRKFPGRRAVLLIIHGGPSSQSRPGFRGSSNYYLNELGIALVYPNVRGSTGYGKAFMDLDNDVKREGALRDIGAVLDGLAADPGFDAARIGVMGGSYGGFMTLASLVTYPDRFRCGVDIVGIANFATFLRDTSAYRRDNRREEYGDERKPEVLAFFDRISPAMNAGKIRAPLFIVQGKNDPRVPVTEAERMRDAIRQTGGQVWYLMATDEGHGFSKKPNIDYQFQSTVLFLREHLLK